MKLNACHVLVLGVVGTLGISLAGCSKGTSSPSTMIGKLSESTKVQSNFSVSVYEADSSNKAIEPALFTDMNQRTGFRLKANKSYVLKITSNISSATFKLSYTNIDVPVAVGSPPVILRVGENLIKAPADPADYSFVITPVASSSMLAMTKTYQASVSCTDQTLSQSDLDGSKIKVTAIGSANLYKYESAGVVRAGAGQGAVTCAWDFNGTNIRESLWKDCNTAVNNVYVTYVANRNVSLLVRDACNSPLQVSAPRTLDATVPALGGGNVFIQGTVSGTPAAINTTPVPTNDPRVFGVNYLATNAAGVSPAPVQPSFNQSSGDHTLSNFKIQASSSFETSLVPFGVTINVTNIKGDYTKSGMNGANGSLNINDAQMDISYLTDQAGDSSPSVLLQGSTAQCHLNNPKGIRTTFVSGPPCNPGEYGSKNSLEVEVWGTYTCTDLAVGSTRSTVNITGSFDGIKSFTDSCYTGGGGGGNPPIAL